MAEIILNGQSVKTEAADMEDLKRQTYASEGLSEDIQRHCVWIVEGFQTDENGVHTERRVSDIRIRDFKAVYHDNKEVLDIRTPVYENVRDYPENNAFGDVPAYGFYIRHADRVTLEDWEVIPRTMNTREALVREYTD